MQRISPLRAKLAQYTALLLLPGGCATAAPPAGSGSDPPSFELSSGVVLEPDPPVAYLMVPEGGIEAVDCVTGETLWKTTEAAKPLAVFGRRLIVQKEAAGRTDVLPIGILDSRDGSGASVAARVPLPPGTRALVNQGLGVSFTVRAWEEQGDLIVAWEYLEQDVTGTSPLPGAVPFLHRAAAAARVDLDSGRIEPLAAAAPSRAAPLPPEVQRLVDAGELRQAPWRVGKILAAVTDQTAQAGQRRVVLGRWDAATGAPLREVTLFAGRPLAQLLSADRRHLLVSSLTDAGTGVWKRYLWSIFSLASGELVAEMRHHRSADRFSILGATLLHLSQPFGRRVGDEWVEEPLKLRAVDLGSGAERWSRALRDTAYRGPRPPSR